MQRTRHNFVTVCGQYVGMIKMMCSRTDCFYSAKGECVNIGVLSADKCARFLHKRLSRTRVKPHPVDLAVLRMALETDAPAIGGTDIPSQKQILV